MLRLHSCVASLVVVRRGSSLAVVQGLLIVVASLVEEPRALGYKGTVVAVRGLSSRSSWVLEHGINGACTPHITVELLNSTYKLHI